MNDTTDDPQVPKFLTKSESLKPPDNGGHINLYDYLRAGHVRRWHILNTSYPQSLAEHSFLVTVIAIELYCAMEGDNKEPEELLCVVMTALFHDMAETRTGDIPTPAKQYIRRQSRQEIFTAIELDLMPEIPYIGGNTPVALQHYVEMADIIEAAVWIDQNGVGAHTRIVADRLRIRMEKKIGELTHVTGVDWHDPVNRVLMALGTLPAHRETELRAL